MPTNQIKRKEFQFNQNNTKTPNLEPRLGDEPLVLANFEPFFKPALGFL